jgi:6-pyruvoyl-tetrahydropterin synthase
VEVVVRGALDPRTETVFDLAQLDAVSQMVLRPLAHTLLDEASTLENLAVYLWANFSAGLGEALAQVTVRVDSARVMVTD